MDFRNAVPAYTPCVLYFVTIVRQENGRYRSPLFSSVYDDAGRVSCRYSAVSMMILVVCHA
jgi:hypothetical protein